MRAHLIFPPKAHYKNVVPRPGVAANLNLIGSSNLPPVLPELWNPVPVGSSRSVPIADFRGQLCGPVSQAPRGLDCSSTVQFLTEALTSVGPVKCLIQEGFETKDAGKSDVDLYTGVMLFNSSISAKF